MKAGALQELMRHRLESLGWSAIELADRAGINKSQVYEYLAGRGLERYADFLTLLELLGVELRVTGQAPWPASAPE